MKNGKSSKKFKILRIEPLLKKYNTARTNTSLPYFRVKLSCVCLIEKKVMTYSDPMVTYSNPKMTYSYPKVT